MNSFGVDDAPEEEISPRGNNLNHRFENTTNSNLGMGGSQRNIFETIDEQK